MISIIGAGPAGSFLAYKLAKSGKDVTLYEEHSQIGSPIQCSGVVTPAIDDIIHIKKEIIVNKIKKVRFIAPNNKDFEVKIKEDYVYDRGKLDRFFAEKAEEAGVEIKLNQRFQDFSKDKDGFKLKFEKAYSNAEILVGADGPFSKVAKSAGLFNNRKFITGLQVRAKTKNIDDKHTVNIHLGYGEFGWSIPEDEYTSRIGVVSEENPRLEFDKLMEVYKADIITHHSGMIPIYNPKIKTQQNNLYLIGDAATHVKGATHGSILYSLIVGEQLEKAINNNLNYEKLWRKKIGFDLWLNLKIRNTLKNFSNEDYNKLVNYFSSNKLKEILSSNVRDFPSKFIFKMLINEPRLLRFIPNTLK